MPAAARDGDHDVMEALVALIPVWDGVGDRNGALHLQVALVIDRAS